MTGLHVKKLSMPKAMYAIELCFNDGDNECKMCDVVEAESLVDAYGKASEIASSLDEKADRSRAFHIISVMREQ